MAEERIIKAFESAKDQWQTCDWHTEFGPLKLDLSGLRSFQLERLGHATSGQESRAWQMAATWVREVEMTAAQAQEFATMARDAFLQKNMDEAMRCINQACDLERRWHRQPIWELLRKAIHDETSVPAT